VLEDEESLSDHRFILLQIGQDSRTQNFRRYVHCLDENLFIEKLEEKIAGGLNPERVDETILTIEKMYKSSRHRRYADQNNQLPYWWSETIDAQLSITRIKRRTYLRETKNEDRREEAREIYKDEKKKLIKLIRNAKRKKWKELCGLLEEDIFGSGYQIVRAQLRCNPPKIQLKQQDLERVFGELFVSSEGQTWDHLFPAVPGSSEALSTEASKEELKHAIDRVKTGKAPGPDEMLPAHVKKMVLNNEKFFRSLFNNCLKTGYFPSKWKRAKLLLLEKPAKEEDSNKKYRPICLLDVLGKLLEIIIDEKLRLEIERTGDLSENQFGFRKGLSTIDALDRVVKAVTGRPEGRIAALICLDVKNAFNTARWDIIMVKLRERGIAKGLLDIIYSYLNNRRVLVGKKEERKVYGGVPQGSVLGPKLWNIMYDGVIKSVQVEGVEAICYADDLALLVTARSAEEVMELGNTALGATNTWMTLHGLQLAPEKTEAIVFGWSHTIRKKIVFQFRDTTITPAKTLKYLGVTLDYMLSFSSHVENVIKKTDRTINALSALLPNVGGPSSSRRKVMAMAVQSTLLYAAPVWSPGLLIARNRARLLACQRKVAVRCCMAYHTVSEEAAAVVSGIVPITLLIDERARVRRRETTEAPSATEKSNIRKTERQKTLNKWQEMWNAGQSGKATWTKTLIPQVKPWLERKHGEIKYEITQFLTGHGCFAKYLHKYKRRDTPACMYGDGSDDSAEHMLFECSRFQVLRTNAELQIGQRLNKENIVEIMLRSKNEWNIIGRMMGEMIRRKESEERTLED